MRCDLPGCDRPATVKIPVGPDLPRLVEIDGEVYEEFDPDRPPVFIEGCSCTDHVDVVRLALRERHQPAYQRLHEGRPPG